MHAGLGCCDSLPRSRNRLECVSHLGFNELFGLRLFEFQTPLLNRTLGQIGFVKGGVKLDH
jgi:hypothetical protein